MLIRDGALPANEEGGPVLGIFPSSPLRAGENIDLSAGDCMVLFTDGVTRLENTPAAEFGEDRLQELLSQLLLWTNNSEPLTCAIGLWEQ